MHQSWNPFSNRALLIYLIVFNVVVAGLAEIQRGALVARTERLVGRLSDDRKADSQQLFAELVTQNKRLSEIHSTIQVFIKNGQFASDREIAGSILAKVEEGKTVRIRFDDNASENRDGSGAVLCGPETQEGYMGAVVAGEIYTVRYDKASNSWVGSGEVQTDRRNAGGSNCPVRSIQSGQGIAPQGAVVLWGAKLTFSGLDVYKDNQKVARVIGLE